MAEYGNATEFDVDLHSIYAAYLGMYETSGVDWWEKSWGGYFNCFGDFLGFGWEVMVVVDGVTGRPHIAVRRSQIASFAKMIRTRFGEALVKDPPTTLPLKPIAGRNMSLRKLYNITDLSTYRKVSTTLPAAELTYLRSRVRNGEVGVAEQLFYAGGSTSERDRGGSGVRDNGVGYTWACVKTTWWEKGGAAQGLIPGQGRTQGKAAGGKGLILEVGMAVVRCANLRAVRVWPPVPAENYRKSHFIVQEWVDKRQNTSPPNYPRAYAFGQSRFLAEKDIERITDATLGALASQESDSNANMLILLSAGDPQPIPIPLLSTLPANILYLDVILLEYNLLRRAQEQGLPGAPERQYPLPTLGALLQALQIPVPPFAPIGNAGNEAYYTVLAFQKLMMAETWLPDLLFAQPQMQHSSPYGYAGGMAYNSYPILPPVPPFARAEGSHRSPASSLRNNSGHAGQEVSLRDSPAVSQRTSYRDLSRNAVPIGPSQRAQPLTPLDQNTATSTPSTVRPDPRPMPRSQTVFWDDAKYADRSDALISRNRPRRSSIGPAADDQDRLLHLRSALKPDKTGGSSRSNSRSISWEEDRPRMPATDSNSIRGRSSPARSSSGVPSRHATPQLPQSRSSGSLPRDFAPITGPSSTKLSVDSKSSTELKSGLKASGDPENKAKGKKVKLDVAKPEKSVKDIAGALARFWVGKRNGEETVTPSIRQRL